LPLLQQYRSSLRFKTFYSYHAWIADVPSTKIYELS